MSESSTSSTWLTQEAFDRLTAELARRKEADRKEIAARASDADRADGTPGADPPDPGRLLPDGVPLEGLLTALSQRGF